MSRWILTARNKRTKEVGQFMVGPSIETAEEVKAHFERVNPLLTVEGEIRDTYGENPELTLKEKGMTSGPASANPQ